MKILLKKFCAKDFIARGPHTGWRSIDRRSNQLGDETLSAITTKIGKAIAMLLMTSMTAWGQHHEEDDVDWTLRWFGTVMDVEFDNYRDAGGDGY